VDYELSEGEPIEAWIWSLFDTADRLQLGVDRVFVFDGAGCIIAEP
jgi:hypothetical protein